jgi:hypothetical protein
MPPTLERLPAADLPVDTAVGLGSNRLVEPSGFHVPGWPCPVRTLTTHVAATVPWLLLR